MRGFFSCVQKDIMIFGRSRVSAFVAVVVPLLVVILMSAAFSSNEVQGVKIGVYVPVEGKTTSSVISNFEKQSFAVAREESSLECIESVKSGANHVCIVFPKDMSSSGDAGAVQFHVDNSRMNLAYFLIDEVKTQIGATSSEISIDLVNDLIVKMQEAKKSLISEKSSIAGAASAVSGIENAADNVANSVPDTSDVLSALEDAKDIADDINSNDSETNDLRDAIDEAITELDSLESSFNSTSADLAKLKIDSASAESKLDGISLHIDGIIADLDSVRATEAESIVSPIRMEVKSVANESGNWNLLFPTLLALMVLFAGTVLASVMSSREKRNRAYFRNFITPTGDFTFLMSMYVSSLIILLVQLIVLFSGLALITNIPIWPVLGKVALILFVSSSAFIFLGIFVGHLFKSEEIVILVSLSLVSLMMFFSNTIVPVETILGKYQQIAFYNPLVIASNLLSRAMLFGASFRALLAGVLLLALTAVVFLALAFAARKATKRFI